VGGIAPQCIPNYVNDRFQILKHFMIPEAQYSEPLALEPTRPRRIFRFLLAMLPPIQFENHFLFKTNEVGDITSNWGLSPKLTAVELSAAQLAP
jgi:hypothetical protein